MLPASTRTSVVVLAVLVALGSTARAQTRLTVDPQRSLAWWQVDPHLGHLWATTCTEEPSWQPGEGRSDGWTVTQGSQRNYEGNASDTMRVPLYPRTRARPLCPDAVEGEVVVVDRALWEGVTGHMTVRAAALRTGHDKRDEYTRKSVLSTNTFPEIRFTIDSVVIAARSADTLIGTALGVFTLRGVSRTVTAGVRAWPEGRGLRVQARLGIPAHQLVPVYQFSLLSLGLGVGSKIWQYVFGGIDVVLRPDEGTP